MVFIKNDANIAGPKTITIKPELFDEANEDIQEFIKLIIKKINPKVTAKQLKVMMKMVKLSNRMGKILNPHLKGDIVYTPTNEEIKQILQEPNTELRLHVPYGVSTKNFAQGSVKIVPTNNYKTN